VTFKLQPENYKPETLSTRPLAATEAHYDNHTEKNYTEHCIKILTA